MRNYLHQPKDLNQRRSSKYPDDTQSLCSNSSYRRHNGHRKPRRSCRQRANDAQSKSYQQPSFLSPQIEVIAYREDEQPESGDSEPQPDRVIILPALEYSAIMLLRRLLARVGLSRGTHPDLILRRIVRAPPEIREVIGWTRAELDEFLHKYRFFFQFVEATSDDPEQDEDKASPKQLLVTISSNAAKLKVRMLTGVSQSLGQQLKASNDVNRATEATELTGQSGFVYHVAKLWAIIDLGQHEHVFFDKSIFRNMEDLKRHFQPGDLVYFNAVLAAQHSRAKWRATRVWKEDDQLALMNMNCDLADASTNAGHGETIPLAPSLQLPTVLDGLFPLQQQNGEKSPKAADFGSDEDLVVDFQEEFDDVRFLGDQDLGLSLLSLADLDNLNEFYQQQEIQSGNKTPTEESKSSTNSQVSSIRTFSIPPSETRLTQDDREVTPTVNSVRRVLTKCQATQTSVTGDFEPAFLYMGSQVTLDDSFHRPSRVDLTTLIKESPILPEQLAPES
ncbi:hypothetical protein Ciccas_004027 [Cichlidogyrus casuarinus]|uniref:Uncharacterized protein n=1 Tax=Cichlidogyrus casuarinus TaxID=1844966 RepID=A0ABD2QDL1_9PLAT